MPVLTDETVAKLKKFQLTAKQIVEGFLIGLHQSPYHGFSVEFSDHRQYNPGESLRDIDWKIVAKTERYYVKRYEEETNLRCYIILDHSRSMFYQSGACSKMDYATQLAGALSWLMMSQKDAVGLVTFNDTITNMLLPKAYRSYLAQIFGVLTNLEPKAETNLLPNLHKIAESIRKRSLIILISDLYDDPQKILTGLKHFRNRHHEVIVFHIQDLMEEQFNFKKETLFVDAETGEKILVNPWQIKKEYLENLASFTEILKNGCHQSQIEYNPVSTATPFNDLLLKYLLKRRKS
ncbi:MAG: DUF58 domain-containing protein [Candidatus Cloacimonadaceae bacterium]|nr:DUF58 domain-containing protein [Candidatus Cloacimonadaceae bacterium]